MFGPSSPCSATTMPSADFCLPITPPLSEVSLLRRTKQISPGIAHPPSSPYTRRIYSHAFRMTIGLWIFSPPRPDVVASYALRVPRAGILLTASSRPRLTAAALAVRLTVPVIRVRSGLSPPSECALPGAPKKGRVVISRPR